MRHFRVSIKNETGKVVGTPLPIGPNDETDIGDTGVYTHHLVLAEDSGQAIAEAETAHAAGEHPAYPTRKSAAELPVTVAAPAPGQPETEEPEPEE